MITPIREDVVESRAWWGMCQSFPFMYAVMMEIGKVTGAIYHIT
jgi:hypothetical protein